MEAGRLTLSSLAEQAGALSFPAEGGELSLGTKKEGIRSLDSDEDKKSSGCGIDYRPPTRPLAMGLSGKSPGSSMNSFPSSFPAAIQPVWGR